MPAPRARGQAELLPGTAAADGACAPCTGWAGSCSRPVGSPDLGGKILPSHSSQS
jgi:hypothetical protein